MSEVKRPKDDGRAVAIAWSSTIRRIKSPGLATSAQYYMESLTNGVRSGDFRDGSCVPDMAVPYLDASIGRCEGLPMI
jgi:hypothetical protein